LEERVLADEREKGVQERSKSSMGNASARVTLG